MPKMKIDYLPNHHDRRMMHTDCKELTDKINILTKDYWCLLSFGDKQQLLYIARMIEKNHQMLPEYRYTGYKYNLNDMLDKYSRKTR